MLRRFIFRMSHYKNLKTYFDEGCLYSHGHQRVQPGYQISYEEIVNKRGNTYTAPCGNPINNFVPFYFSPITAMAYTIDQGNVSLTSPDGRSLGKASLDDVAFIVVDPLKIDSSATQFWFSDAACNSGILPEFENDIEKLEEHIDWLLFDEQPKTGQIKEIDYLGVCKYFFDRDSPERHQQRSHKRMAEFLLKDSLQMDMVECIVIKNDTHKADIDKWVAKSGLETPVYVKPRCYF